MKDQSGNRLLNQDLALEDYLGDLLTPSENTQQVKSVVDVDLKSVVHPFPTKELQNNIAVDRPAVVQIFDGSDQVAEPAKLLQTECPSGESLDIIPEWGKSSFACTSIIVDGIPMLFPSHFVKSVIAFPHQLHPVKNQPDWVLGLAMQEKGFVAVVDSEYLFFNKNSPSIQGTLTKRNQHVLVFGDGRWGLACDRVESEQTVQSKDVRWRTDDSHRKWLAGMLKQPAAPLINPEQLFVVT